MSELDPVHIQSLLDLRLNKLGKDFLTLKQMLGLKSIPKALNLAANAPVKDILLRLEPYLGEQFKIYKCGKKIYLGRNRSDADIVLSAVLANPGSKTLKQWAQSLPLTVPTIMEVVNTLLTSGQLSVRFVNKPETVKLFPGITQKTITETPTLKTEKVAIEENDPVAFKTAYDIVRGGREVVRIYKLREHLNWSKTRFDTTIAKLRAAYKIDLHLGDPSRMSKAEVDDSYIDPHGTLYIGITWRV